MFRVWETKFNFQTAFFGALILFVFFIAVEAQQFRFDHWTVEQGLPQNSVYSIVQTPDGYLWLTTFDGLVRFDGVRFTVFNKANLKNLPSNRFTSLFADEDGSLWVLTESDGVFRFQNGQVQNFTTADGLLSNTTIQVQKNTDGSLLITTDTGLSRWHQDQLETEKIEDFRKFKVYVSPSGSRWELDAAGLKKIGRDGSQTQFQLPFSPDRIAPDRTFNYVSYVAMLEDNSGVLWLAASGNLYKLKDGSFTILSEKEKMPQSFVRDIAQDSLGNIWIGTEKDGACQLKENIFNCYGKSKGLTSNFVRDIFSDREGTIWITTNEGGINRLTKQTVTSLSTEQGLPDKNIYPIFQDKEEDIWIGTETALTKLKDGKIQNFSRQNGLFYEIVQSLHKDGQGRLWIGAVGGIQYLKDGKINDFTTQLGLKIGEGVFWDIHEDKNGVLWFATAKGLVKLEGQRAGYITTENGLPSNDVRVILEKKDGSFLIGTYGGLALMDKEGAILQTFTPKNGLAGNYIRSIYEDSNGVIWIGTYDSGLSRLENGKFTNFNTSNGLFSNGVFAILEDNRGNFWMSSNQGIYRVSRRELNDFADGKISKINSTAYGKSDGMLNAECNGGRQPSAFKNKDGKLWFPTQDGIAIIDPEAVPFNPNPPPVVIESAILSGTNLDLKDLLEIQPSQDNLEIRYTGLSFIKPEQTRFRYKLEGLDEGWTEAGTRREAYYPYLPPGNYTFKVIAANSDNVWNEQGASLRIMVYPAFYRTWWFWGLSVLAFVVFVFLLYTRRITEVQRKQVAQEEFSRKLINAHETERRRIAAELHDSLGQHLAMIKNSAVFGEQIVKNVDQAKQHLSKISEQSAQAIAEVREISHNLRPYILDRLGLTKAINSMLNKITDTTELNVNTDIHDIDGIFPKETEMSIYRIIQESLNNILKHAEAAEVNLSIENNEHSVKIEITDNGKGFDLQDGKKEGFGLLGIKERAKIIGGEVSISSAIGKGTTVFIKLNK